MALGYLYAMIGITLIVPTGAAILWNDKTVSKKEVWFSSFVVILLINLSIYLSVVALKG